MTVVAGPVREGSARWVELSRGLGTRANEPQPGGGTNHRLATGGETPGWRGELRRLPCAAGCLALSGGDAEAIGDGDAEAIGDGDGVEHGMRDGDGEPVGDDDGAGMSDGDGAGSLTGEGSFTP